MRIHRHRQRRPTLVIPAFKVNQKIRSEEVVVIDETGQNLGAMSTEAAIALSEERGFDLVEVSPKAVPPVCRLIDYGQFKYQKEKEAKKQKAQAKEVDIKGLRLTPRIGDHDTEVRLKQALKFLANGNKIQLELRLRGREKAHRDLAETVIKQFVANVNAKHPIKMEQQIQFMGGKLTALIAHDAVAAQKKGAQKPQATESDEETTETESET